VQAQLRRSKEAPKNDDAEPSRLSHEQNYLHDMRFVLS